MNILSIQGGGIRGIVPAMILAEFEQQTRLPVRAHFDLIVGTSTGAIMAIALSLGLSAAELVGLYATKGAFIFERRWLLGLIHARYSIRHLRMVLQEYFGDALFGDCDTRTMVTALEVCTNKAHLIKSWKHGGISAVDAASASAAAPTYFDPVTIAPSNAFEGGQFVDGGIFANNPAPQAMIEAWKLSNRSHALKLVDLACPAPTRRPRPPRAGVVGMLPRLADMFINAGMDSAQHITSVAMNGAYLPLQPDLDLASPEMDDASAANIENLRWAGGRQAPALAARIIAHIEAKESSPA